jgi:methionine aminotransferase
MQAPSFRSKLPATTDSIFSHMSHMANTHQALNLSQGFPDFPIDPDLIERAHFYMQQGFNQYAPMPGVSALRDVIAGFYRLPYHTESEICVTHGATQAIATAISCAVAQGDEVLLFAPAYDCYAPMIEVNGGIPRYIDLSFPEFSIDWEQVQRNIGPRTRMIVINTPHNPSGTLLRQEDFEQLEALVVKHQLLVLSDEVYQHIVLHGKKHLSAADFPALRARTFVVGSFGKSLHITGWKLGYCAAPVALMTEFKKVHQYMVFSVNHALQHAVAEHINQLDISSVAQLYSQKQALFVKGISNSNFKPLACSGSFFQLLDYRAISREDDLPFAERLTREPGVAAIPLSGFYANRAQNKVLRFCFAKSDETLVEATKRLSLL